MSFHIRHQIRAAVIAALKGQTTAAGNVHGRRDWPFDRDMPALLVWTEGGPSRFDSMADSDAEIPLERIETVVVELRCRAGGGEESAPHLEDALDALAAEVEPLMMNDTGLAAVVDQRQLVDSKSMTQLAGDVRLGSCRLTYRMLVTTAASAPTVKV